jgi:hypothetical protein
LATFASDEFWSTFKPKGLRGPDSPSETFRLLEGKEEREFGKRLTKTPGLGGMG